MLGLVVVAQRAPAPSRRGGESASGGAGRGRGRGPGWGAGAEGGGGREGRTQHGPRPVPLMYGARRRAALCVTELQVRALVRVRLARLARAVGDRLSGWARDEPAAGGAVDAEPASRLDERGRRVGGLQLEHHLQLHRPHHPSRALPDHVEPADPCVDRRASEADQVVGAYVVLPRPFGIQLSGAARAVPPKAPPQGQPTWSLTTTVTPVSESTVPNEQHLFHTAVVLSLSVTVEHSCSPTLIVAYLRRAGTNEACSGRRGGLVLTDRKPPRRKPHCCPGFPGFRPG